MTIYPREENFTPDWPEPAPRYLAGECAARSETAFGRGVWYTAMGAVDHGIGRGEILTA